MAEKRRVIDPESIYHAMSRGSDRKPIVWDARDYGCLCDCLHRVATRYEWEVFAWCAMPNHYHVVLRTTLNGFSRGFQVMNQTHSLRTNRRYGRSAHLFKNRPNCVEVASDAHLLGAIVYVVRNPIRAGLCERAWEWPYSSYRGTVGLEQAPAWLKVEFVLDLFGGAAEFARVVHREQLPVSETVVCEPLATRE